MDLALRDMDALERLDSPARFSAAGFPPAVALSGLADAEQVRAASFNDQGESGSSLLERIANR